MTAPQSKPVPAEKTQPNGLDPAVSCKLVQMEPTPEMLAAGARMEKYYDLESEPENTAAAIWRAMFNVAPTVPLDPAVSCWCQPEGPPHSKACPMHESRKTLDAEASPQPAAEVPPNNYVQPVPDHCDRIVWRGHYYHLPLTAGESRTNAHLAAPRDAARADQDSGLKPCPFCGGKPYSVDLAGWEIHCDCGVQLCRARPDKEALVEHWNTRVDLGAPEVEWLGKLVTEQGIRDVYAESEAPTSGVQAVAPADPHNPRCVECNKPVTKPGYTCFACVKKRNAGAQGMKVGHYPDGEPFGYFTDEERDKALAAYGVQASHQAQRDAFVAEMVEGLRRAEEKRKQGIAALPPGTCATCMGEGYLGSIESQRVTDCPDCVGGRQEEA